MKMHDKKLTEFVDSASNSEKENNFMEQSLDAYTREKLKSKYENILQKEYKVEREKEKGKPTNKIWWGFAILAILTFVGSIFIWQQSSKFENNAVQYASNVLENDLNFQINGATRGNMEDREVLSNKLFTFYDEENYLETVKSFESLKASFPVTNKELFVAGISNAKIGKTIASISLLNDIMDTKETPYSYHQESRWVLSMLFLNSGDKEYSKTMLKAIKQDHYKYKEAQELISKF